MADFEKPPSFTAVNINGRPPSPPRSHPADVQQRPREQQGTNGGHTVAEAPTPIHTPSEARSVPPAQAAYRPSSAERDAAKVDSTAADQSPSRKRTHPEAFDESSNSQYPPRSAPPREGPGHNSGQIHPQAHVSAQEYRSPEVYQDVAPNHPQYNGPAQSGSPYSTDPGLDETDRRTMEALKANSGTTSPPRDHYGDEDEDEDDEEGQQGMGQMMSSANTPTRTAAGVLTKDANKRKRVFSNRTKTGCMTCRKRKKKCDEKHPECQNCLRGGFVCEGYTPRASWQKPSSSQPRGPTSLAALQIKGPGMTPQRQHSLHYPDTPQEFRPDPRHEEHRREMSMAGPPPPPPHHHPEVLRQPYPRQDGRYPPNQGLNPRYEPEAREHIMHNGPMHEPGPYPPGPAGAFPPHQAPIHPGAPPAPMHPAGQATAAAALEHVNNALPPASSLMNGSALDAKLLIRRPGEHSERDKMLTGEYYLPYTPALMADRDQCSAAVYRFNQACQNPSLGFTHMDRERLFREIAGLRPNAEQPYSASPLQNGAGDDGSTQADAMIPRGRVGPGCVVEAPFQCDYGYNLQIGADVVIGANCRIADVCNVRLDNGVVLSPGVTLMCATYGIDPKERRKGKGRALGRGIHVEEGAWIGTNVTILPGVRVGKCSTVGAGSMIHKDVPPFTVVAGNPPKVVRGIGSSEEDRMDQQ